MIFILIPLAPGTDPHQDTLAAIASQSVPCKVVTRCEPFIRTRDRLGDMRRHLCANRNALIKDASCPYTVYLNHDVVFSSSHDVADMMQFLDANNDYDAVALDTKGIDIAKYERNRHVVEACVMIRATSLVGYTWTADAHHCPCINFNAMFRVRYLDDRRLS